MKTWKVKRISGYSGGHSGELNVTLRVVGKGISMDEAERLVAEAPNLADALERLVTVCKGAGWLRRPGDAIEEAESALASLKAPAEVAS